MGEVSSRSAILVQCALLPSAASLAITGRHSEDTSTNRTYWSLPSLAAAAAGLISWWLRTLGRPARPSVEPWCLRHAVCIWLLLAPIQSNRLGNVPHAGSLVAAACQAQPQPRQTHKGSEQRLHDAHVLHIALLPSRGGVLHRRQRGLSLRWVLTLGLQLRPHLQQIWHKFSITLHTPAELVFQAELGSVSLWTQVPAAACLHSAAPAPGPALLLAPPASEG